MLHPHYSDLIDNYTYILHQH